MDAVGRNNLSMFLAEYYLSDSMKRPDPADLRDLGGLLTVDGRRVRSGVIYRSRQLADVPCESTSALLEGLRIRTVVDLRTDLERSEAGWFEDHLLETVNHRRLPISADGVPVYGHLRAVGCRGTSSLYYHILAHEGDSIKEWFRLLADEKNLPVLVHCVAGRHRTGLLTAVTLLSIGVKRTEVERDYLISCPGREDCFKALVAIIEELGGVEATLSAMGVDDGVISRIKENLLESVG